LRRRRAWHLTSPTLAAEGGKGAELYNAAASKADCDPLVPKSKPKRRKSQAYLIKVAHNAGLIVERLHPDGSVQVRDNKEAGLQANGHAYENSWDKVLNHVDR
jgi:hypothetical protein